MYIDFSGLLAELSKGLAAAVAEATKAAAAAAAALANVHRQEGAIRLATMLQQDQQAAEAAASAMAPAPLANPAGPMPEPGTFDPEIGSFGDAAAPMVSPQAAAAAMPTGRKPSRQATGDRAATPEEAAA